MFFFKQKTAYEMRISDWSSDVCSSDLIGSREQRRERHFLLGAITFGDTLDGIAHRFGPFVLVGFEVVRADNSQTKADNADRKSVVKGKSVSVRVELGGRRIYNKKNIAKHSKQRQANTYTNNTNT